MYESDVQQYAMPAPRAKMLRRFKRGALLGILISVSLLVCSVVAYNQDTADRIN